MLLGLFVGFVALGVWQIERLAWKTELIAQVDARVHAAPAPAPGPTQWSSITRQNDQYRRVVLKGTYRHDRETLVQALTALGGGWWVLTPLQTQDGIILVNRGYVPDDRRDRATRQAALPTGRVTVTGLMRDPEPGGGFLRSNDPAADRWFSRDVAAIARARQLGATAPFFIDADDTSNPGGYPVGGLTVISFHNNHLSYAVTWFALALLSVAGAVMVLRSGRRR